MNNHPPFDICDSARSQNIYACGEQNHLLCVEFLLNTAPRYIDKIKLYKICISRRAKETADFIYNILTQDEIQHITRTIGTYTNNDNLNIAMGNDDVDMFVRTIEHLSPELANNLPSDILEKSIISSKNNIAIFLTTYTNNTNFYISKEISEYASRFDRDDILIAALRSKYIQFESGITNMNTRTCVKFIEECSGHLLKQDDTISEWINERRESIRETLDNYLLYPLVCIIFKYSSL